jgi:hypothetical protein
MTGTEGVGAEVNSVYRDGMEQPRILARLNMCFGRKLCGKAVLFRCFELPDSNAGISAMTDILSAWDSVGRKVSTRLMILSGPQELRVSILAV